MTTFPAASSKSTADREFEGTQMKLNQVRAVITGGASGLGNAVAQRLVAAGAQVTLIDVNEAA
ncbi:MAG TPA: SDR family NAD(P)-dependent oxidoreductase, partial [Steroidobacteraceae bacterium]|nr:SDR family NAD(P)-dependent oxidoreductase [Steroidobacteraceae bacterium]